MVADISLSLSRRSSVCRPQVGVCAQGRGSCGHHPSTGRAVHAIAQCLSVVAVAGALHAAASRRGPAWRVRGSHTVGRCAVSPRVLWRDPLLAIARGHGRRDCLASPLTENEPFSVKMAPFGADTATLPGCHRTCKQCPAGARQRGNACWGLPHGAYLCPVHIFGLIFFPLFTDYIDIFCVDVSSSERKASYALPHWHADL